MDNRQSFLDYSNSLMYELEKAFYDERGKGARFRTTKVGSKFYQDYCQPKIKTQNIDEMIKVIEDALKNAGIIAKIEPVIEERMLRIAVHGCLHRPVEEEMISHGIEPFTCIPANLVVRAVEETLKQPVEIAEIKIKEGICHLLLVVFDARTE
jgi:hypothetical protein